MNELNQGCPYEELDSKCAIFVDIIRVSLHHWFQAPLPLSRSVQNTPEPSDVSCSESKYEE